MFNTEIYKDDGSVPKKEICYNCYNCNFIGKSCLRHPEITQSELLELWSSHMLTYPGAPFLDLSSECQHSRPPYLP